MSRGGEPGRRGVGERPARDALRERQRLPDGVRGRGRSSVGTQRPQKGLVSETVVWTGDSLILPGTPGRNRHGRT